jgi:hypothetical protein
MRSNRSARGTRFPTRLHGKPGRRKTRDEDRNGVMLRRVRHFLQTGAVLRQTCIPPVVRFGAVPRKLTAGDRLSYGR